jgi:hypothetical protein
MNSVHISHISLRSILILSHLHVGLHNGIVPSGFLTKILYVFRIFICVLHARHILHLTALIINVSGEGCEPWSSSLRSFLQTLLTPKYSLEHPERWGTHPISKRDSKDDSSITATEDSIHRSQWPREVYGTKCPRPLKHWDHGFESHSSMDVCVYSMCVCVCVCVCFLCRYRPCDRLMTRPSSPANCL